MSIKLLSLEAPTWTIAEEYHIEKDSDFSRILDFFLWYNPCNKSSFKTVTLDELGYKSSLLNDSSLQDYFFSQTFQTEIKNNHSTFSFKSKSREELAQNLDNFNLSDEFYLNPEQERFIVSHASLKVSNNKWITFLHRMRNAFAHGRVGEANHGQNSVYIMEDGTKEKGNFILTSRMVIQKRTLLQIIDFFEKPNFIRSPLEDNILLTLYNYKAINKALGIEEERLLDNPQLPLFSETITSGWKIARKHLKQAGLISCRDSVWFLTDNGLNWVLNQKSYFKLRYDINF